MREILFRGKIKDTGEWGEGIPIKNQIGTFICFDENPHYCYQYGYMEIDEIIQVDPETVCQFTGLIDKNGEKIFEKDIVYYPFENEHFTVCWDEEESRFIIDRIDAYHSFGCVYGNELEVVGNVFDNPELVEVQHE